MRVVSGAARGKTLLPVPGMTTRPTTDRVKESIFNIVQMRVRGARVLDLFAGTGQMGIEALSRGAAHADFVDSDRRAIETVRRNLAGARVDAQATVHQMDFRQYLAGCGRRGADLIFLDPPYGGELLQNALLEIERFDILSPDGIIICESAVEDRWDCPFVRGREYRYGTIRVALLTAPAEPKTP